MRLSAALCVLLMGLTAARAEAGPHFSDDGSLQVESVWARMAPKEADTASVFFEVTSHSSKSDELLSASSPVAETITLRRGTWKGWDFFNKASEGIRIKANKRTSFHPGAYEVTLTDFTAPVGVRSTIPVTLVFKDAGTVTVEAVVANQLLGNRIKK